MAANSLGFTMGRPNICLKEGGGGLGLK